MKIKDGKEIESGSQDARRELNENAQHLEYIMNTIANIKELYKKRIKEAEDFLTNNTKTLKQYRIKDEKKRELKKCLRRLRDYWNNVKVFDQQVKKEINGLLEFKHIDEQLFDIDELNSPQGSSQERINSTIMPDDYRIRNMGFLDQASKKQAEMSISANYQLLVFQLLESFLKLHYHLMYYLFHQADIVCIIDSDSPKKNITLNECISRILAPKLTREQCSNIIETKLKDAGIEKIPISSILKQLSSWNTYISSNTKKGIKPLSGYEIARLQTEKQFGKWVIEIYLPDYRQRHKIGRNPLNNTAHGDAAQDEAAIRLYKSDPDKFYKKIDREIQSK